MKQSYLAGLGVLILITAVSWSINSCSVIGYGIGAASDAAAPDRMNISGLLVNMLTPGTSIVILQKNAPSLSGKFIRLKPIPTDKYAESYTHFREQLDGAPYFPALLDSFYLTINKKGSFIGFDCGCLVFRSGIKDTIKLALENINQLIDNSGNEIDVEPLKKFMSEFKIPCLSEIVVQKSAAIHSVKLDEIESIYVPLKKKGKFTGLFFGAVMDLFLVIFFVRAMQDLTD